MAPLPLAAPEAKPSYNILSSVSNFLFPNPKPDVADRKNDQLNVPVLFGLGIPKPARGEDMPKATVMFPPESTTGFGNTDEYAELMKNPWNDYRKRSLQDPGSSTIAVTTGMDSSMQHELEECRLTMSQEISLLIFTWLAAMLICGAIAWILAKVERMMKRFAERGVAGFGEKRGWRLALHFVGYGSLIIVIIAMFLMLVGVMLSLKELLGTAIWDA
ncbi:hypothetical protein HOY80DRAFT_1025759 [Tuber brumale]|nr:hypothetical protein HOY80DRAFT_1025759 [Tuber brumale]